MRGFLGFVMLAAGCMGAPVDVSESNSAGSTAFANDKAAYDFFVQKGLTNFQAAGIVGNLDQESGVDPTIAQYGGGPGRGIAQWSTGGRWDTSNPNAVAYASSKGESVWSLNLQLEFIWYELTTVGYGFSALKATTNVTDATITFMAKYEICGTCASSQRVSYAKSVLAAYGVAPNWQANFVSQTWPYASQPAFQVKCGEAVSANIVMKNNGASTWDGSTRLGTTQPRDRASIFTGSDWIGPNRAAGIQGTVAPGADGTFTFSFHGPTGADCKPGTYSEYFGIVQEGVAWFSDSGQGGPPDDQLEALIELVPGDPSTTTPDMGGGNTGGGGGGSTGGGGSGGGSSGGGSSGGTGTGDNGAGTQMPSDGATTQSGGCSVAGGSAGVGPLFLLLLGLRRRRRD